jgi:hypothetical protein
MRKLATITVLALAFPIFVAELFAQGGATGLISGVVQDQTGGAVAGASVRAVYENTRELARTQTTAPFQGLAPTGYQASISDANSHYNSLQITVAHRIGAGLYLQSAYTYSKSIDDTSTASISFSTRYHDQNNPKESRGPSDFDRTHRSITSFVYQEPLFRDRQGPLARIARDGTLSGVLTLQSGSPFTVIDSAGGSAVGSSSPGLTTPCSRLVLVVRMP